MHRNGNSRHSQHVVNVLYCTFKQQVSTLTTCQLMYTQCTVPYKGQLADAQVCAFLVVPDLPQCLGARPPLCFATSWRLVEPPLVRLLLSKQLNCNQIHYCYNDRSRHSRHLINVLYCTYKQQVSTLTTLILYSTNTLYCTVHGCIEITTLDTHDIESMYCTVHSSNRSRHSRHSI